MAERIPRSKAIRVHFNAIITSSGAAATGKTIVVTISKNGAAFANPSVGATTATEIGSGSYYADLSATDTGTLGPLVVLGTAALVTPIKVEYDVVTLAASNAETPTAGSSAPSGANFLTAIDIANRALDHCGQESIDPALGFTENSKRAAICARVYTKLRRAELRRNLWRFATRRAILRAIAADTMLLRPSLWGASTVYFVGSIVTDENGQLWTSNSPNNTGNQPNNSTLWEEYFGPLTVSPYDSTLGYFAGELVYTAAGAGTYRTYLSLQNNNTDNPATATAWSTTATYDKNQVVTYLSVAYMSLIDLNLNQQPNLAPALWASGTTYGAAAQVGASDGVIYTSIAGGNVGFDPTTDGGVHWTNTGVLNPWTTVFVGGAGSLKWLQVGGAEFPFGVALATINIIYPIGTGPSTQNTTRNTYRLPFGFLRATSQDPKAGSQSALGAPAGLLYNDWLFEGNYIVTSETGPLMLRFVADTVDVPSFDDLFCEGLAARIGMEICEPLTQSSEKVKLCSNIYAEHMGTARTVNGIEIGAEEPPMDNYLACRF